MCVTYRLSLFTCESTVVLYTAVFPRRLCSRTSVYWEPRIMAFKPYFWVYNNLLLQLTIRIFGLYTTNFGAVISVAAALLQRHKYIYPCIWRTFSNKNYQWPHGNSLSAGYLKLLFNTHILRTGFNPKVERNTWFASAANLLNEILLAMSQQLGRKRNECHPTVHF